MKKQELIKYLKELPPEKLASEALRLAEEGTALPPSAIKRLEEYRRVLLMREFDGENALPVAGVDEAGRGPLAGRVYAAAVVFPKDVIIEGLNDSKKLSEKKREELFGEIVQKAESFCIAFEEAEEIDRVNIRNATLSAMKKAVEGLKTQPAHVLVDGNALPKLLVDASFVIKGDSKSMAISAASILAKVTRDRYIKELDETYPQYGFAKNKGYGTADHIDAIKKYGPCPLHRKTFIKNFQ